MMSSKVVNRAEKIAVTIDGKEYVIKNRYGTADDVMYLEDMLRDESFDREDYIKNSTVREVIDGERVIPPAHKCYKLDICHGYSLAREKKDGDWLLQIEHEQFPFAIEEINLTDIIKEYEVNQIKHRYRNGHNIPFENFQHLTVNEFRDLFDKFNFLFL